AGPSSAASSSNDSSATIASIGTYRAVLLFQLLFPASFLVLANRWGNLIRCQPAKGTCGNVDETQTAFANVSVSATPNGSLLVHRVGQGQSGRYQCQGLLRLQSVRTETLVNVH
uniref:FCGR2 protein n=1 Tax=Macrostomum lignano TaxID=282301 RepID=A0A1I8JNN3_9PLAT